MCQHPGCMRCTGPADARLVEPYQHHRSPSRRQTDSDVKRLSRVRWRQEYATQAEAEIASAAALGDRQEVVRAAVYAKLEAKVS